MALPGATQDGRRDTRALPRGRTATADHATRRPDRLWGPQAARARESAGPMVLSYAVSADAIAMCMSRYW